MFSCRFLVYRLTAAIPVAACFLFVFVMSALLRTAFTDPGIIPRASAQEAAELNKLIGKFLSISQWLVEDKLLLTDLGSSYHSFQLSNQWACGMKLGVHVKT